jgi:hypothetical protein
MAALIPLERLMVTVAAFACQHTFGEEVRQGEREKSPPIFIPHRNLFLGRMDGNAE